MAKKFKFRMEAVLRYRQMLEDERKNEFAKANIAVREKQRQIDELGDERKSAMDEVRKMSEVGKINMNALTDTLRYVGGLEMGIMNASQEAEQLKQAMEGVRLQFVAAKRDKRAVEVIKEKRKTHNDYENARDFQHELDEVSLRVLHKKNKRRRNYGRRA